MSVNRNTPQPFDAGAAARQMLFPNGVQHPNGSCGIGPLSAMPRPMPQLPRDSFSTAAASNPNPNPLAVLPGGGGGGSIGGAHPPSSSRFPLSATGAGPMSCRYTSWTSGKSRGLVGPGSCDAAAWEEEAFPYDVDGMPFVGEEEEEEDFVPCPCSRTTMPSASEFRAWANAFSWKELEHSCRKLDEANLKITEVDLTGVEEDDDDGNENSMQLKFEVELPAAAATTAAAPGGATSGPLAPMPLHMTQSSSSGYEPGSAHSSSALLPRGGSPSWGSPSSTGTSSPATANSSSRLRGAVTFPPQQLGLEASRFRGESTWSAGKESEGHGLGLGGSSSSSGSSGGSGGSSSSMKMHKVVVLPSQTKDHQPTQPASVAAVPAASVDESDSAKLLQREQQAAEKQLQQSASVDGGPANSATVAAAQPLSPAAASAIGRSRSRMFRQMVSAMKTRCGELFVSRRRMPGVPA